MTMGSLELSAQAEVKTEHASRYLVQLCAQLDEKARNQPELDVRVEWSETTAIADFGWARCTMKAGTDALVLRACADDQAGLAQVTELLTRHLEKHGAVEQITVGWQQSGTPAADLDARNRRDTMRGFHRRMRH